MCTMWGKHQVCVYNFVFEQPESHRGWQAKEAETKSWGILCHLSGLCQTCQHLQFTSCFAKVTAGVTQTLKGLSCLPTLCTLCSLSSASCAWCSRQAEREGPVFSLEIFYCLWSHWNFQTMVGWGEGRFSYFNFIKGFWSKCAFSVLI